MAYDSLKNIIRQYIKTNGEQEITGQIMQNVLIEMVNNYPSTEGYIRATLSNLANGDILVYDSVGAWYNTPMSSFLAGYATQLWVNQQGYVTSSALAGYIHPTITDLANGDILIYDSVGAWVNAPLDTIISGFGYVKSTGSVAYATSAGSANILGHSVYENPAHALANGDMLVYDSGTGWTNVETSSILSGYATQSWVTSQGYLTSSALNGYATQSWVTSQGYIQPTLSNLADGNILVYDAQGGNWVNTSWPLTGYATQSWVNTNYLNRVSTNSGDIYINDGGSAWVLANLNTLIVGYGYITASALNGYATEAWVGQQGYLTSSALNGYIHPTITNLANGDILIYDSVGTWVNTPLSSFGFATQTWVGQQGYITASALNGYATQSWVTNQGYINSTELSNQLYNYTKRNDTGYYYWAGNGNYSWCRIAVLTTKNSYINYPITFELSSRSGAATWVQVKFQNSGSADPPLEYIKSLHGKSFYIKRVGTSTWELYWNAIDGVWGVLALHRVFKATNGIGVDIKMDSVSAPSGTTQASEWFAYIGGTSSQFIKADGSYDSNTYITSAGSCAYASSAGNISISATSGDILINDGGSSWLTTNLNSAISGFGYIKSSGSCNYATSAGSVAWSNVSGRPTNVSSFTNDSGYITSSGSCNYATSSGTTNGINISANSGDILICDGGRAWVTVPSSYISDIRKKDVLNYNAEPTFEAVANAPAIKFTYKDNTYSFRRGIHVGSIAQYWQTTLPETVSMDNDGMLSMKYDVIALLSTISVAKKVSEHERRIVILERENEELRKELAALKSA